MGVAMKGCIISGMIAVLVTLGVYAPCRAGDKGTVLMPGSIAAEEFGGYEELAAQFWQWAFSMPVDAHPLFDTADCSEGQSGDVWFLGGTFAALEIEPGVFVGEATRDCHVPADTALFFPIVNTECSTLEGNGKNEKQLRACANFFADFITVASAKIDGKPVKNLLQDFRVESPLFIYGPLPENNLFGNPDFEGETSRAVADGVHVLVAPLSEGTHRIEYYGELDLTEVGGPLFIQDIRYNITVSGD
jgi:hypothetical protein